MIAKLTDVTKTAPNSASAANDQVTEDRKLSLKALASRIVSDAKQDNLRYLIRSNTSHDGE